MQVRLYTAKNVFQNLQLAKQEFIQGSVYVEEATKICLPKVLSYFAKDMSLNMQELLEVVTGCLTQSERKEMETCIKASPGLKCIHWLPHTSTFGYVIHAHAELAPPTPSQPPS